MLLDNSFTVHERNVQTLVIEIFKVIDNISAEIMKDIFVLKNKQNYCSQQIFETRNIHSGLDTLATLGPKIWVIVPNRPRAHDKIITSSDPKHTIGKIKRLRYNLKINGGLAT